MTPSRKLASTLAFGALAWTVFGVTGAWSGETGGLTSVRCREFGTGYVDLGNGVCEKVSGHIGGQVRVQLGSRDGAQAGWGSAATASHAAIRSYDGGGLAGSATAAQHLRVPGGMGSFSPFP